jgi:hypothetical protein
MTEKQLAAKTKVGNSKTAALGRSRTNLVSKDSVTI